MFNICGDNDNLSVAEMYMDKTTCEWLLWWDSTMKGGSLVRDCNTFKKKNLNDLKTWKKSISITNSLVYNKKEPWRTI